MVTVLMNPSDRAGLRPLARKSWGDEAFAVGARVAYVWCPEGVLKSRVVEAVNRVLGDASTSRNWATIQKLHALVGEDRP
jgi:uncharacterized protein (DUF1697 family)